MWYNPQFTCTQVGLVQMIPGFRPFEVYTSSPDVLVLGAILDEHLSQMKMRVYQVFSPFFHKVFADWWQADMCPELFILRKDVLLANLEGDRPSSPVHSEAHPLQESARLSGPKFLDPMSPCDSDPYSSSELPPVVLADWESPIKAC